MGGKKRQAEAQKKADEKAQLETLGQAGGAYSAYRPQTQQAMNYALQQQLSTFSGINSLLDQMGLTGFGGGEQYGNVVSPEMMKIGQTSKAPGFAEDQKPAGKGNKNNKPKGTRNPRNPSGTKKGK